MRNDAISDIRPPQAFGANRNAKAEENALGANSPAVSPAATRNESVLAIQPVAPKPLISGNTLVVTTSIASSGEVETTTAPSAGKSGQSPAFSAREAIAETPSLADLPFGRVVSAIARGIDPSQLLSEVPQPEAVPAEVPQEAAPVEVTETPAPAQATVENADVEPGGENLLVTTAIVGDVTEADLSLLKALYA